MLHLLKRHPIPIKAHFRYSLVLTYALPQSILIPLLPPGLFLDTFQDFGFVAIALVQTEHLRPAFMPKFLGQNFFLSGYRIFARYKTQEERTLRGLRILRSDTNRHLMATVGNLLTHYHYRKAKVETLETAETLEIKILTPNAEANLHLKAHLQSIPASLPKGSPFHDLKEARKYAGPLPFTFDYEDETHSIIRIEGVRKEWNPEPVQVEVLENTFFNQPCFQGTNPILANAFYVKEIDYLWKVGIREPLELKK